MAGAALGVVIAASCAGTTNRGTNSDLHGKRIEVVAVWSGSEQARFEQVLSAFERQTGVSVTYTTAGRSSVADFLRPRLASGRPPDIALLPQPGLIRQYVQNGLVVPIDSMVGGEVKHNYTTVWQRLGSVGGHLYAVWFKAANKSLIWYNVGAFERAGVVPPENVDGLIALAGAFTRSGVPAFSVGGADGWTLTDWFANLYLQIAGPGRYDLLAAHRIPWTDESVKETLRLLARVLAPGLIAGGATGALATTYDASVTDTFADPPTAAMVFEGDFVAGAITGETRAELGVDADVFPFPSVAQSGPGVVGGGDAAVLMRRSAAGAALLRYLASPAAASIWAAHGGFVSPNLNVDLAVYPDGISRSIARSVLDAGDDFRFGLSDLQPAGFGGTEGQGLRKELQDFLVTRDVDATTARLEAEAEAAFTP